MTDFSKMQNMAHMAHIDAIAASDCETLRRKEATYRGSWKAAGGRSAWFMMRRNMDRLLEMMKPPIPPDDETSWEVTENTTKTVLNVVCPLPSTISPDNQKRTQRGIQYMRDLVRSEDIFAKIEEHPDGEDGTVRAVLQDLRRYAMLVEAEMAARGVVVVEPVPAQTYNVKCETRPVGVYGATGTTNLRVLRAEREDDGSITVVVDAWPRTIVEPTVVATTQQLARRAVGPDFNHAQASERRVPRFDHVENDRVMPESILMCHHVSIALTAADTSSCGDGSFDHHAQRTPEDGAQHASLAPWVVRGRGYFERKDIAGDYTTIFWSQRGLDCFVLEPHVRSSRIPRVLRDVYDMRGETWTLRIGQCPADARNMFPVLSREVNMKEHEELPEWQRVLYEWREIEVKFRLNERSVAWHVESE